MQATKSDLGFQAKLPHTGRWVLGLLAGFAALGGMNAWLSWRSFALPTWGFMPPQMAMAQYPAQDVVGNVGGMPVTISKDIARFVEYDGDPTFGERRLGPPPRRTHQSAIRSFGFHMRFPDWATFDQKGAEQDFRQSGVATRQWILVGVTSGKFYPKDGFLDRAVHLRTVLQGPYPLDQYIQVPSEYPGLTAFAIPGIDPAKGTPYRSSGLAEDVFVARSPTGKVTAYILCTTHQRYPSCDHSWSLEELGISSQVSASYPKRMLNHWEAIQKGGTDRLLAFKSDGT